MKTTNLRVAVLLLFALFTLAVMVLVSVNNLRSKSLASVECIPRDQTSEASEFSVWGLARVVGSSTVYACSGFGFSNVRWVGSNEEIAGIFRIETFKDELVACWEVEPSLVGDGKAAICRPVCPRVEERP